MGRVLSDSVRRSVRRGNRSAAYRTAAAPAPALPKIEEKPEADPTPPSQRPSRRPSKPVVLREATPDAACQLLSLLQREGRFLDFLQEDLADASDGEIGAAARVVHQGCRQAVEQHFDIVPVLAEEEGRSITIDEGFDASEVRLTGNVVGEPPFRGTLSHRGWRAASVTMPQDDGEPRRPDSGSG